MPFGGGGAIAAARAAPADRTVTASDVTAATLPHQAIIFSLLCSRAAVRARRKPARGVLACLQSGRAALPIRRAMESERSPGSSVDRWKKDLAGRQPLGNTGRPRSRQ